MVLCWQIMKASLFAEDEEESDIFQDHSVMKVSDVSSPRFMFPGAQGRPSGRNTLTVFLSSLIGSC